MKHCKACEREGDEITCVICHKTDCYANNSRGKPHMKNGNCTRRTITILPGFSCKQYLRVVTRPRGNEE